MATTVTEMDNKEVLAMIGIKIEEKQLKVGVQKTKQNSQEQKARHRQGG